jgi:hypothetical protein
MKKEEIRKIVKQVMRELEEGPKEKRQPRVCSVAACVSEDERDEILAVCDEYVGKMRIRSRGGLLRLVWLYFKDNHESIDLEPYRD